MAGRNRLRRWLDRNMPTQDGMRANRWIAPFADRVLRPELWRFTRRSVPRGVSLGLFIGILIPVGQIVIAALLALTFRANVPVAAVTTFVTNPFTTPFVFVMAYKIGRFALRLDQLTYGQPLTTQVQSDAGSWLHWITGAVPVTALGLFILAVIGAVLGHLVTAVAWRLWIARKWRGRGHIGLPHSPRSA